MSKSTQSPQEDHRDAMRAVLPADWFGVPYKYDSEAYISEWFDYPNEAQDRFDAVTSLEMSPSIITSPCAFLRVTEAFAWDTFLILSNPVFPVLCLEDPGFFASIISGYLDAMDATVNEATMLQLHPTFNNHQMFCMAVYMGWGGHESIAEHYHARMQTACEDPYSDVEVGGQMLPPGRARMEIMCRAWNEGVEGPNREVTQVAISSVLEMLLQSVRVPWLLPQFFAPLAPDFLSNK